MLHYPVIENNISYYSTYPLTYFTTSNDITGDVHSIRLNRKCTADVNEKIRKSKIYISLLTGDALFDDIMLDYVKNIMNNKVGVIQVPHHGFYKNWKKVCELQNNFIEYAISFGLGNCYHHPHSKTIEEIKNNNGSIYEVNQLDGFYYYIEICGSAL